MLGEQLDAQKSDQTGDPSLPVKSTMASTIFYRNIQLCVLWGWWFTPQAARTHAMAKYKMEHSFPVLLKWPLSLRNTKSQLTPAGVKREPCSSPLWSPGLRWTSLRAGRLWILILADRSKTSAAAAQERGHSRHFHTITSWFMESNWKHWRWRKKWAISI